MWLQTISKPVWLFIAFLGLAVVIECSSHKNAGGLFAGILMVALGCVGYLRLLRRP